MRVPGGRTLAATTQEGVLRFIDPARGSVAGPTLGDATDESVVFDPRGARVATNTNSPAIRDARSGTPLVRLQDATYVFDEAFSANGRELFTLQEATSNMTELRRYDALTGLPIGPPRLLPNGANLPQGPAVLALRRGHRIVTLVSGHVALRDARTLAALWTFDDPAIRHVAVSPDERTLLLGGEDGTLTFVDLPAGTVHRVPGRESRAVVQLAFSPDGHTAASAGADNQILLWDVARRTVRETLPGHSATVTGLVFGSGGGTLYSSGLDGRILIWDVAGDRRLGRPFTLAPGPAGAALSPDGRTLAVAHADGTVQPGRTRDAALAHAARERPGARGRRVHRRRSSARDRAARQAIAGLRRRDRHADRRARTAARRPRLAARAERRRARSPPGTRLARRGDGPAARRRAGRPGAPASTGAPAAWSASASAPTGARSPWRRTTASSSWTSRACASAGS